MIYKETGTFIHKPKYHSHISVIRGDLKLDHIKHGHGHIILFDYDFPETDGDYWWLPVKSEILYDLRIKQGLSPYPEMDFHLTIGKIDNK